MIIQQIKSSNSFKALKEFKGYYNLTMHEDSDKIIWNYNVKDSYIIETYEKKPGYSPFKLTLNINKHSDIIDLTVIQD